jgi:20S proteasome alpha/beta subunit
MTVCIAALADNNNKLILVADRMISISSPMAYQYETDDVAKIYDLTEKVVVMTAGNAIFANVIVEKSKKKITASTPTTVEEIAEIVKDEYVYFRNQMIEDHYLVPRQMTMKEYYERQSTLNMAVIQDLEDKIVNTNLGVDLIVAGHNGEDCYVYSIGHPGVLLPHNQIGYACVGIGAPHAIYSLIDSEYKKTLTVKKVEELVLKAKQRSEKAPGVGKQTSKKILPET